MLVWLKRAVLSKWFLHGLLLWCTGWLWFFAWHHYKWSCVVQFVCILVVGDTLYTRGETAALEWTNKRLDGIIERLNNRIEAATAPKKPENTWLA